MAEGRIFSGMRPTGRLHLGNYFGALANWVKLQDDYPGIYSVVDVHALTTLSGRDAVATIKPDTHEMVLDWLAAGLDPQRNIIFVQSQVREVLTLHALLSMSTPLGWLLRVPTFKERVRQMGEDEENVPYGLVGYPVLQAADVILYKAVGVPVGADQVSHIELMREIARRFNRLYGDTFPEPQVLLTETPAYRRHGRVRQDEQEPRQSHRTRRDRGGDAAEGPLHGDRPTASASDGPRPSRGVQRLRAAQELQSRQARTRVPAVH